MPADADDAYAAGIALPGATRHRSGSPAAGGAGARDVRQASWSAGRVLLTATAFGRARHLPTVTFPTLECSGASAGHVSGCRLTWTTFVAA